ncbi:hypothetical protein ACJZ2D_005847 [Fusarium nematophilum]
MSSDSSAPVSLNSCFICRSRKVKCDKTHPECTTCRRLGVQCPGYDDGGSAVSRKDLQPLVDRAYRTSGLERRRIGACVNCQSAKTRCSRALPRCKRCVAQNTECVYDSASAKHRSKKAPRSQHGDSATPSTISTASPGVPPAFGASSPDGADSMGLHEAANVIQDVDMSDHTPLDGDSWLFRHDLPTDNAQLRMLSDLFFSRVHPRRCLGFIYRPAWMQSLDQGTLTDKFGEALVALVCALGARCLSRTTNHRLSQTTFRHRAPIPGYKWAEWAKKSVLSTLTQSSLRNLMALTLLTEYCLQTGKFADAFQLLGNCYRSIRLLSLDSPAQYEPSQVQGDRTQKESQVRIVWACYTMDLVLCAGVQENSSWWRPPRIPLPVSDSDFLSQMPPSTPMPSNLDAFAATSGAGCLSGRAHYNDTTKLDLGYTGITRVSVLEADQRAGCVVQYSAGTSPAVLGPHLRATGDEDSIFDYESASRLSRCHISIDEGVVAWFQLPLSSTMRRAPPAFVSQCQTRCRFHSDQISRIIEIALPHGMEPFDDQFCGVAALEASKVQIIHAAIIQHGDPEAMKAADRCIRTNLALMEMTSAGANLLPLRIITALLKQHSFTDLAHSITEKLGSRSPEERSTADFNGNAENCYLTAIAAFRLAREELQASDLSSPASVNSTRVDEDSPAVAPPLISTTQNPVSQHGDIGLAAPGGEWEESQIDPVLQGHNHIISNMEHFDMVDLDFMNHGANYLMWNYTSLGAWAEMDPSDHGTEQLYMDVE